MPLLGGATGGVGRWWCEVVAVAVDWSSFLVWERGECGVSSGAGARGSGANDCVCYVLVVEMCHFT